MQFRRYPLAPPFLLLAEEAEADRPWIWSFALGQGRQIEMNEKKNEMINKTEENTKQDCEIKEEARYYKGEAAAEVRLSN